MNINLMALIFDITGAEKRDDIFIPPNAPSFNVWRKSGYIFLPGGNKYIKLTTLATNGRSLVGDRS